MQLIDGKAVAAEVKGKIKSEVEAMRERGERAPGLVAILVGDDGASRTYVAAKEKACEALGFYSEVLRLPASTTQEELLCEVARLNGDDRVDGFIVQMPLPRHIDEQKIIEAIDPRKDVDGFHPVNVGKVSLGLRPAFVSATPAGVMELLKHYNIETSGKSCVVIGRSNIVGRPMSILMSEKGVDCTVTLVHSRTVGIEKICREADIIIAALGIAEFLKGDMVKEGAVVIDVGITRVEDASKKNGFRLLGDVNWAEVSPKCSYITPVPGGVGPMTIVSLMLNTLLARQLNK
ncbi:MAG: tetrahydrofolate dehydrogenase/cyclohydrolase catalytic domain-containing protein [Rikenellaceae bacterium]